MQGVLYIMLMDGYKDELRPVFKSTPTQFQTIIFASGDKQNVGDFVGDMSVTCRRRNLLNVNKKYSILLNGVDNLKILILGLKVTLLAGACLCPFFRAGYE